MKIYLNFIKSGNIGLEYNTQMVDEKCLELDNIYYSAVRRLEIEYGYFVSDHKSKLSYRDIEPFISCGFSGESFSKKYFWDSVEIFRSIDPFLNALYDEYYAKHDISELLRIKVSISNKCKLQYDIIGTVSGRILVTRPGIQYLKRATRGIFIPSHGKLFIYADYAQFEPGILAFLSNDQELKNAYNSGDVYNSICRAIGNECTRDLAKQLFLSYIYGMNIENIKKNIILRFGKIAATSVEKMLKKYSDVEKWKMKVCRESIYNRHAIGLTGYIRNFSDSDKANDIIRWAPNHIIQSTAAGIFKKALSYYLDSAHYGRMLVPMHDAILIEVNEEYEDCEKTTILHCMKESFESLCPGIICNIRFDRFDH
jgi:hypothetical protein